MKDHKRELVAVIPAAGKGSRLNAGIPKAFVPIDSESRLVDAVVRTVGDLADMIVLIVSPDAEYHLRAQPVVAASRVVSETQSSPTGMLDAILLSQPHWPSGGAIAVVWGDQVNLSSNTITQSLRLHEWQPRTIVVPLVQVKQPYVQYDVGVGGQLIGIRESREGDVCDAQGLGDVGTFVMSTDGLAEVLATYREAATPSPITGEINFLPFIPQAQTLGWKVLTLEIRDPAEARGVNTPADLDFARERRSGGIR